MKEKKLAHGLTRVVKQKVILRQSVGWFVSENDGSTDETV